MAPAEPPDPMPWKRPFQSPAGGSQTSNPISEPASGLATPATRQNETSSTTKPRELKVSGGVKGGVTSSATVIVVCGRPRSAVSTAAQASPCAVAAATDAPVAGRASSAVSVGIPNVAQASARKNAYNSRVFMCTPKSCLRSPGARRRGFGPRTSSTSRTVANPRWGNTVRRPSTTASTGGSAPRGYCSDASRSWARAPESRFSIP